MALESLRHIAALWILVSILVSGAYAGGSHALVVGDSFDIGAVEEGEEAVFNIPLRNASIRPLEIHSIDPLCDYVEVFPYPGEIGAGERIVVSGRIETAQTLGRIAKTLEVLTGDSSEPHIIHISVFVKHPAPGPMGSEKIFQGRCGKCHAGKGISSKTGEMLFYEACYMCHKDGPSLSNAERGDVLRTILNGVPGTSMPGFSEDRGGPLSNDQVDSLVEFLLGR